MLYWSVIRLRHDSPWRSGSQFTRFSFIGCISLYKRKAKIKHQADFFCFRQVSLTKSFQQIWWRVNQPLMLFIHYILGKQYYKAPWFYHKDLG